MKVVNISGAQSQGQQSGTMYTTNQGIVYTSVAGSGGEVGTAVNFSNAQPLPPQSIQLPTTPVQVPNAPPSSAVASANNSASGGGPTTSTPAGPSGASTSNNDSSATPKRGKKRTSTGKTKSPSAATAARHGNPVVTAPPGVGVEDIPCAPDDEDLSTPYPCTQCNKTVKGRIMLQAHQYQEHYENPEIQTLGDLGDKHICRVCLKLFTRNSDVKAHILRVHCGDRRYPCKVCGKRFKESTHLRKHLYTHTGKGRI